MTFIFYKERMNGLVGTEKWVWCLEYWTERYHMTVECAGCLMEKNWVKRRCIFKHCNQKITTKEPQGSFVLIRMEMDSLHTCTAHCGQFCFCYLADNPFIILQR
ncbi:MAG: hypothetical protein COA50_06865 [Flavobacteriaceae bacterium]|nr:MAG: hypothetical protein COA50_06865 [Flavobacteriaceae bacterium]